MRTEVNITGWSVRRRLTYWVRAAPPFGEGGVNWTGAPAGGADAVSGACAGGGAGIGSGQIGSTAVGPGDWPVIVAVEALVWLADCLRACRAVDGGLGFAAAAAATPGNTGPVGSGFMMLTAGIDAALGKSILTM
jgi:hypothetical protein